MVYTFVGALVWLFIGVPLAGFALYVLTAPFRAIGRMRDRGKPPPLTPEEAVRKFWENGPHQ